ncbi:chemotaxis protein CheW [Bilifractor sp. LCP21S3_A7]|uniref:chemotaxis protein CheW n=1 Tax=Bilifractor sp. LCP21S3_A7 TaxID=3438738 RepID=UPI003F92D4E8
MDDNMLEAYLFEENELLDKLDEMLVADEKEGDFSTDDVNEIFRIMHTIKGSSAMMSFDSISTIAHKVEDLFFFIRDKGIDFVGPEDKKDLFDLMFQSEDRLRSEVEKVENGEPLTQNTDDFTATVAAFLDRLKKDEKAEEAAEKAEEKTEKKSPEASDTKQTPAADVLPKQDAAVINAKIAGLLEDKTAVQFIHIFLEEGVGMENLRAFMIVNSLQDCDISFRVYPKNLDTDPATAQAVIDNGFFIALDSADDCKKAIGVLQSQNHIRSFEILDAPAAESSAPAEKKSLASESQPPVRPESSEGKAAAAAKHDSAPAKNVPPKKNTPIKQSLISVNLQKLDSLMNLVGEIVITESMVTSSPVLKMLPQEAFDNFNKSARQLRKLTDDLQDISMSLRMVPISGVFQKMNRIVRDMKSKLGKDVKLTIIGEDTEVDKSIVDSIQDPIMHIVRNSMDHGIEATAEERIRAGKNPQGEIVLSASHTSSEVVISVSDDGYGMDYNAILDKAEQKGILTKPKSSYSPREALALILLPGFSTNKEVTEYSGRGVGMDVVKKNVESVGGSVRIESEYGKGTVITLKIPLTMAIVDGMKVTVGDSIFTIPISNISQSFKVTASDLILDETGSEMIERMGNFYPLVRLNRFYNIPAKYDTNIEDGIMIWVEAGEKSCVLYADDLIGEQQVVVKPLPTYFNNYDLKSVGISGCTILGDGNISIILDVAGIYSASVENA